MSGQPVWFLDHCLVGKWLLGALQANKWDVRSLHSVYDVDTPDDVWLPDVAKMGWVVITKDKYIKKRRNEVQAVKSSGARLFVLAKGNLRAEAISSLILSHRDRMFSIVAKTPGPFIYKITERTLEPVDLA